VPSQKQDKVLEYVQLAHSHRDPVTRKPSVKILYNLGRADRLDMNALRRLVRRSTSSSLTLRARSSRSRARTPARDSAGGASARTSAPTWPRRWSASP
jgi:hypothetical protein